MIIVTGAAGFIGSNLVRALNRLGRDDLFLVDELDAMVGNRNLDGARFADCVAPARLFDALGRMGAVEAIFHQGACTSTTELDVGKMMAANFDYSRRLLEHAEALPTRFIYASSAAVYGDGKRGFREEPACEGPLNPYALSKLRFDDLVRRRRPAGSGPNGRPQVVGLRYFNVYGPGEEHKGPMASAVLQFWRQLERTGRIQLFEGSEDFRRDFVFVDDVVAANIHFFEHPAVSGIFNCGSGVSHSFVDVANLLVALRGGGDVGQVHFPDHLHGRYQALTCADRTLLLASGFAHPFLGLAEGVARYAAALTAHPPPVVSTWQQR